MSEPRPCKRCGMRIETIEGPNPGKFIPAQRIRTVYRRQVNRLQKIDLPDEIFVSHFETCPYAGEFSKKRTP